MSTNKKLFAKIPGYDVRSASPADASALLAIYAPFITDTCVSFETEVPSEADFAVRIDNAVRDYAWLVCEAGGGIAGYAYAAKHRERAAYRYSADVSVYISPKYQRAGVGTALYAKLFDIMRARGLYTAYAAITIPNEGSVGLHKSLGFTEAGVFRHVGYKHGGWLDVLWMEKPLRAYGTPD